MNFRLTKHPGRISCGREETFIKACGNIFFNGAQSCNKFVAVGSCGVPGKLFVGVFVSKKLSHFVHVFCFVHNDRCPTFICGKDADGIVLFKVIESSTLLFGDIGRR